MEEEGGAPEDLKSWWPGGGNGGFSEPPANPWHRPFPEAPQPPPPPPPQSRPQPAPSPPQPQFTAAPQLVPELPAPQDWPSVRSEIRSLVRMSETVLDTLASQLRQDEQAARLFSQHLGNVDTDLQRLLQRLDTSIPGSDERGSALAALGNYADAVRRLETGMQALFGELERMQRVQQMSQSGPGVSAALAEQSATLRTIHGTLTSALGEQAAAMRSLQGDLAAATSGQAPGLQSLQGHLQAALAEQSLTLRSLQGNLTAALAEQGATLRSLEGGAVGAESARAEFERLRSELLANQDRQFASLMGMIRDAVSEELRRAQATAPPEAGFSGAMAEQAAALRSLQGDLTAVLSEQAAAIRALQVGAMDTKSLRADLERVRSELLANQERQFGNLVGVVRTLLQQSEDVVVALGRVPKSAQAGRAFEMLRLSSANWETSDRPR